MEPQQMMGADWANYSVIRDYSTGQRIFEIHLAINLGDEDTAKTVEDLLKDASTAGKSTDPEAKELKKVLRAVLKKNGKLNPSTDRMVGAILLK